MTRNTFLEIASTHYFLHAEAIFCIVRGWDILPIMRGLSLYIRQEWRTVKALCLFFIPSFPYPWVVSIAPLKTRSFSERQEFDSFWQFTSLKRKIKKSIPQMPKKSKWVWSRTAFLSVCLKDLSTNPFWCFKHAKIQQPKFYWFVFTKHDHAELCPQLQRKVIEISTIYYTRQYNPPIFQQRKKWHSSGKMLYW